MKEQYRELTRKEAIEIIDSLAEEKVYVTAICYDRQRSQTGIIKPVKRKKSIRMIKSARTIVFTGNQLVSQIELYDRQQPDIYHINRIGSIRSILLKGITESI